MRIRFRIFQALVLLFFISAVVYVAFAMPNAISDLIQRGPEDPEFWSLLFITTVIGGGAIGLGYAVIHIAILEVSAVRRRSKSEDRK